ncbi:MAG: AAA family ATPase [Planctomycetota bacterium]
MKLFEYGRKSIQPIVFRIEQLWTSLANVKKRHILLLDEIQHFRDWSSRLKSEWDLVQHRKLPVHVAVSGSSALKLGSGARESLAGRFDRMVLTHWSALDVARVFRLAHEVSAELSVVWGTYPGTVRLRDEPLRWRAAPPKIIILNNALLAAFDPRGVPSRGTDAALYGQWVENACIAHAINRGQSVMYWREEPFEVDAVVQGSWGRWAIEIKTGPFGSADLQGLFEFTKRFSQFKPLILCDAEHSAAATRLGIVAMPWKKFLLRGHPASAPLEVK